jgi:hypothetical protein
MKSLVIPKCSSLTFTPFLILLLVAGKILSPPSFFSNGCDYSSLPNAFFEFTKRSRLWWLFNGRFFISVMCFLIRPTDASVTATPPSACRVRRKMAATRTWCAVASTARPVETAKNASRFIMTVRGPAPPPTMPMNAFVSQMCSFISSALCVRRRNSLPV